MPISGIFYVPLHHQSDRKTMFKKTDPNTQLDMFTDYAAREEEARQRQAERSREKKVQKTILEIKGKFGKNAILKGANLEEGATAQSRNKQIGGHKA